MSTWEIGIFSLLFILNSFLRFFRTYWVFQYFVGEILPSGVAEVLVERPGGVERTAAAG